jgi:hypothetical protein
MCRRKTTKTMIDEVQEASSAYRRGLLNIMPQKGNVTDVF